MKKAVLIFALAAAIGTGLYLSPFGQEKIVKPVLQQSIKNQTPEERYELVVDALQKNILNGLDSMEDINPYTFTYGEDFPLQSKWTETGDITLHQIPDMITGGTEVGITKASFHTEAVTQVDLTSWLHRKMSADASFDLKADLNGSIKEQAQTDTAELNGEMKMILDGENIFLKLIDIKANTDLFQLDNPEVKPILDDIKGKWVLFNDAMTNPFIPKGLDPNTINEKFLTSFKATLENNMKDFQMWKSPISGVREGEWYRYELELDKEAYLASLKKTYTDTVNDLTDSIFYEKSKENDAQKEEMRDVYLSVLDEMNLDMIDTVTLDLGLHATELEQWTADIKLLLTNGEEQSVQMARTDGGFSGKILVNQAETLAWDIQPNTFSISSDQGALNGNYSDTKIDITTTAQDTKMAELHLMRANEKAPWNGNLTIPALHEKPLVEWNIGEKDYVMTIMQPKQDYDFSGGYDQEPVITSSIAEHKIAGTYSEDSFTMAYTQNGSGQSLITANFTKESETWSGKVEMLPVGSIEVEKYRYDLSSEIVLLTHLIIQDQKTLTVDYKANNEKVSRVNITAPKDAMPLVEITEDIYGVDPFQAQYGEEPETMSEEEIQAFLKSLDESVDVVEEEK